MNLAEDNRAEDRQLEHLISKLDERVVDVEKARDTFSSLAKYSYSESDGEIVGIPAFTLDKNKHLIDSYLYSVACSVEQGKFLDELREAKLKVERNSAAIDSIDAALEEIEVGLRKGPNAEDRDRLNRRQVSYQASRVKKTSQLQKSENALNSLSAIEGPHNIRDLNMGDYFNLESVVHEVFSVEDSTIDSPSQFEMGSKSESAKRNGIYSLAALSLLAAGGIAYMLTGPSKDVDGDSITSTRTAISTNATPNLISTAITKVNKPALQNLVKSGGLSSDQFDAFVRETLMPLIFDGRDDAIYPQYSGRADGVKIGEQILDSGYVLNDVDWDKGIVSISGIEKYVFGFGSKNIALDVPPNDLTTKYTLFASKEHEQVLVSDAFKGNILIDDSLYGRIGQYLESKILMIKIVKGSKEMDLELSYDPRGKRSQDFNASWLFDGDDNEQIVSSQLNVGLNLREEYSLNGQQFVWITRKLEERGRAANIVFNKIDYTRPGDTLEKMVEGRFDHSNDEINRSAKEVQDHFLEIMRGNPFNVNYEFGNVWNFREGEGDQKTQTALLEADWGNRKLAFQVDKQRVDVQFHGDYAICELPNQEYLIVGRDEQIVGYAPDMKCTIELDDDLMRSLNAYGHDIKMIQVIGKENALLGFDLIGDKFITDSFDPSIILNHRDSRLNLTIDLKKEYNFDSKDRDPTYSRRWEKLKNNPAKLYFEQIAR